MDIKKRLALTLSGAAILTAEWLLVRFPLLDLHGMKEWPWDLFVIGLIAVVIAGALGAKWAALGAVTGYLTGFFCGVIFNFPGPAPDTTAGWAVWTFVFLAGILLGIAASVIIPIVSKRKYSK